MTSKETLVASSVRHVSKLARISPTKTASTHILSSNLNERMISEYFSKTRLLIPRHPQQLEISSK